jgi:hypothetical protein
MLKAVTAAILSLLFITGCTPHPGSGAWLSPGANADDITKVEVFFEPKVKIYTSVSAEPALQCGWWAIDKLALEMECVYLANTELKVKYQLKVTGDDTADLYKNGRFVTRLFRQRD